MKDGGGENLEVAKSTVQAGLLLTSFDCIVLYTCHSLAELFLPQTQTRPFRRCTSSVPSRTRFDRINPLLWDLVVKPSPKAEIML